jgi:hypothetical protein
MEFTADVIAPLSRTNNSLSRATSGAYGVKFASANQLTTAAADAGTASAGAPQCMDDLFVLRRARGLREHPEGSRVRDLLAPVYGWFSEGFDTADLKEAKGLVVELT